MLGMDMGLNLTTLKSWLDWKSSVRCVTDWDTRCPNFRISVKDGHKSWAGKKFGQEVHFYRVRKCQLSTSGDGGGGVAGGDYGATKFSLLCNHSLAPWLSSWRIFIRKSVRPQLSSVCSFEQDTHKLAFMLSQWMERIMDLVSDQLTVTLDKLFSSFDGE